MYIQNICVSGVDDIVSLKGTNAPTKYPKHLIPKYTRNGFVYIWVLNGAKKMKNNIEIESKGIQWANIDIEDQK